MATTVIEVIGMSCDHCKHSVETALAECAGVESAVVDLDAGTATVVHDDSVAFDTFKNAIEEVGYDVA